MCASARNRDECHIIRLSHRLIPQSLCDEWLLSTKCERLSVDHWPPNPFLDMVVSMYWPYRRILLALSRSGGLCVSLSDIESYADGRFATRGWLGHSSRVRSRGADQTNSNLLILQVEDWALGWQPRQVEIYFYKKKKKDWCYRYSNKQTKKGKNNKNKTNKLGVVGFQSHRLVWLSWWKPKGSHKPEDGSLRRKVQVTRIAFLECTPGVPSRSRDRTDGNGGPCSTGFGWTVVAAPCDSRHNGPKP